MRDNLTLLTRNVLHIGMRIKISPVRQFNTDRTYTCVESTVKCSLTNQLACSNHRSQSFWKTTKPEVAESVCSCVCEMLTSTNISWSCEVVNPYIHVFSKICFMFILFLNRNEGSYRAACGTSYLLTSETRSQSWWRPQMTDRRRSR